MYFSENLEYCTMTDVSFCEDGVGSLRYEPRKTPFLNFFNGDYRPAPPPAFPVYPSGGDPSPPAHPDGLHSTGSSTGRARCKADRPQQAAHRHTRPDAGHAAPGRSGRRRALDCLRSVSETEQIRTLEQYAKTGLKIITILCMFVACATLQIH